MNADETHIGVRVPREIAERIQRVAERTHRNKSQVVRMCVEQYITDAEAELGLNSSVPPGEAAAGPVAVAALTKRGPTPPVGGSIGAASSPARAGRTAKARQQ